MITGGRATAGGGIFSIGTVNMSGGSISDNSATGAGGGIFNHGTLQDDATVITGNTPDNVYPSYDSYS